MPSETRTIYFDQDDLRDAVTGYPEQGRLSPSRGRLDEIAADPSRINIVTIRYITEAGREEMFLSYAAMLDVLIHYCRVQAIPLPRRGLKQLVPNGTSIALVVRISEKTGADLVEEMQKLESLASRHGGFVAG